MNKDNVVKVDVETFNGLLAKLEEVTDGELEEFNYRLQRQVDK